jgi:NADPH:quinone reductase-like Zn-dependent oxidoreductase
VTAVSANETDLKVNDTILVVDSNLWADQSIVSTSTVSKLSSLNSDEAATLPTFLSAWALLNNFTKLSSGDTVIQSNGSSALGMAVSQVGKALGINVLSPSAADLNDAKFVSKTKADKHTIKLSISDRSGRTSLDFARITANDGTLVVYNGTIETLEQSQGIDQSAGSAIYKNVSIAGFDFGLWHRTAKADGTFQKALDEVLALGVAKKLNLKPKMYAQADFQKALAEVESSGSAVVLKF